MDWVIFEFRCAFLFIIPLACNYCALAVAKMIQENFNIFSLTDYDVEAIIVICQCFINGTLDDEGLIWIQLPTLKSCTSPFNGLHFGQVEKTELSGIMNDNSENVWNKGFVKQRLGLVFLEL